MAKYGVRVLTHSSQTVETEEKKVEGSHDARDPSRPSTRLSTSCEYMYNVYSSIYLIEGALPLSYNNTGFNVTEHSLSQSAGCEYS